MDTSIYNQFYTCLLSERTCDLKPEVRVLILASLLTSQVSVCVYIYTYIYTYIYMCIYTYIYVHNALSTLFSLSLSKFPHL